MSTLSTGSVTHWPPGFGHGSVIRNYGSVSLRFYHWQEEISQKMQNLGYIIKQSMKVHRLTFKNNWCSGVFRVRKKYLRIRCPALNINHLWPCRVYICEACVHSYSFVFYLLCIEFCYHCPCLGVTSLLLFLHTLLYSGRRKTEQLVV